MNYLSVSGPDGREGCSVYPSAAFQPVIGQPIKMHCPDIRNGVRRVRRKNMLLAFDVGNTNIVLGVFKGKKLIQNWRMETDKDKSADEYGMLINQLFKYHNPEHRRR